jgi:hypothetical protein
MKYKQKFKLILTKPSKEVLEEAKRIAKQNGTPFILTEKMLAKYHKGSLKRVYEQ